MCGISGFLTKQYNSEHLQKMTNTLLHRGHDTEGVFIDENIGIGLDHRRLRLLLMNLKMSFYLVLMLAPALLVSCAKKLFY